MQQRSSSSFRRIFRYLVILSSCWITQTISEPGGDIILNKMVVTIVENCNLGLESIIIYSNNNNKSIFEALSNLEIPVTKLLMSGKQMVDAMDNFYDVKNQGLILAINTHSENFPLYNDIMFEWRCKENCTVIIVPKLYDNCINSLLNLEYMARMSIYNAYYVCIKDSVPLVFTYDLYGNSRPPHWKASAHKKVNYNPFTIYRRYFEGVATCQGFVFERLNITQKNTILVAMNEKIFPRQYRHKLKDGFYGDKIKKILTSPQEELSILEKLTRVKFTYYLRNSRDNESDYNAFIFKILLADISVVLKIETDNKLYQYNFVPTFWNHYAILSQNRGLRTPLEKISHFYGVWTLLSLIVISILTFIVIYYKMRGNISFAAFDILRLLINGDICVPMDTLSLKIYFCMVFMYFMVIHATFSGNLAKFLTIPEDRKNIDTVNDLKDSRIKTVYCSENICQTDDSFIGLRKKIIKVDNIQTCINLTIKDPKSACIGVLRTLKDFVVINLNNSSLYLSEKFAPLSACYTYRKQFTLIERFNKVFLYMNELDLSYRFYSERERNQSRLLEGHKERSEISFRAINSEDVKFAFIFLTICNGLSIVCFIIELIIYRKGKNIKQCNWIHFLYSKTNLWKLKILK